MIVLVTAALVAFESSTRLSSERDSSPATRPAQEATADIPVVSEIVDGDTITVRFVSGVEPVRLLGIDTPESVDPTRPLQCFGVDATIRLTELIPPGTELRLERDIEARDRYGRLLAYIYRAADGLFVNELMLREGYADLSVIAPNDAHRHRLEHAFVTARTAEEGLWSACGGPDVPVDPPLPITGRG